MSLKKSLVEITHDEGYGDVLIDHINIAFRGKDMRADRIVDELGLRLAVERGGYDVSPCLILQELAVCITDGLAMCRICAEKAGGQMTSNATKVCDSVVEWIRRSLFYGESFEVSSKVDESWSPAGRFVVFEAKSGENTNRVTFRVDIIEDGRIPERTLKLEAWYLLGRVRGLT